MDYHGNPNPSSNNNNGFIDNFDPFELEISDYLVFGDNNPGMETMATASTSSGKFEDLDRDEFARATEREDSCNYNMNYHGNGLKNKKIERGNRVAFRTKSELEVMDDGYKWRKYGKKSVKDSPNPRNYYKCSNGGCKVKKRVERDKEDFSYVITTYEGIHNHPIPSSYSSSTFFFSDFSTLQASNGSNSSSSS